MAKKKTKKPAKSALPSRPPVVTIMGHVDHGKTSLLDFIRKTKVQTSEHGGITQHIGAYQVDHKGKQITFIDTPGHAAFANMRARGASVTDIVVLVVAANDGVKPQTVESINHIKAAKVPFIVAINKTDLPTADPNLAKSQLVKYDVSVEGYGGQIPVVEISAKTGKNIDKLLETILLVAELEELNLDPASPLETIAIESHLDKRRGAVATLLVKSGTLKVGQIVFTNGDQIKIRALTTDDGKQVKSATPSTPVQTLGFKFPPEVGSIISAIKDTAVKLPELPSIKTKPVMIEDKPDKKTKKEAKKAADLALEDLEDLGTDEAEERPHITIILKSDTTGTLEAIKANFTEEIDIVGEGVGEVNESDVTLAENTGAAIIGFNVKVSKLSQSLANNTNITIKTYNIIYKILEDLEAQILKLMEPTIDEEELGTAEVIAIFKIRGDKIAGCKVKTGEISKKFPVHLKRDDKIITDAKIKSLKKEKTDVINVKAGSECGIVFGSKIDFKKGDVIMSYKMIEN